MCVCLYISPPKIKVSVTSNVLCVCVYECGMCVCEVQVNGACLNIFPPIFRFQGSQTMFELYMRMMCVCSMCVGEVCVVFEG